jgi:hypothetical protein
MLEAQVGVVGEPFQAERAELTPAAIRGQGISDRDRLADPPFLFRPNAHRRFPRT